MPKTARMAAVLLAATATVLSGCVSNESGGDDRPSPQATATVTVDKALADLVPAKIKDTGTLIAGTDPTYPPNEYKDPSGKIVGFDVELFDAVAAKLGLKTQYVASTFDNIIPSVIGGTYQVGVSSFTDNPEREQKVDMVSYFNAGTQWVATAGQNVTPDTACGLTVSVQTGTVQVDDLQARSDECTEAGKQSITIQKFDAQADATTAVILGKVNAMTTDFPVAVDAVKQSKGKVELIGDQYKSAPYGYAIGKGQGTLAQAVRGALQAIIDDGTYAAVLSRWGVSAGAVDAAKINPMTN